MPLENEILENIKPKGKKNLVTKFSPTHPFFSIIYYLLEGRGGKHLFCSVQFRLQPLPYQRVLSLLVILTSVLHLTRVQASKLAVFSG